MADCVKFSWLFPTFPTPACRSAKARRRTQVRQWGSATKFDFTPKPHWDLGPELGILDLERAAKFTGARFAVYWGLGAKLERGLINFMLDLHTREHGYTEVLPPFLVNSRTFMARGSCRNSQRTCFTFARDGTLVDPDSGGSGHESVSAMKRSIKRAADLRCAYTPCFRSEAGSYGKDVRGIIRQHQFQKVELVKFARPEQSYDEHERLTRDAEEILQKLGLHYRVVTLCTGDMGASFGENLRH